MRSNLKRSIKEATMIFREWELTPPSMNTVKTTFIHKSELNVNATPQVIISLSAKGNFFLNQASRLNRT